MAGKSHLGQRLSADRLNQEETDTPEIKSARLAKGKGVLNEKLVRRVKRFFRVEKAGLLMMERRRAEKSKLSGSSTNFSRHLFFTQPCDGRYIYPQF
jgi:hypothetical protein